MINGDIKIKIWIANTLSFSDLKTYQSNFDQTLHFSINNAFAEVFGKSIKYADMTIRGIYNDISIRVILIWTELENRNRSFIFIKNRIYNTNLFNITMFNEDQLRTKIPR